MDCPIIFLALFVWPVLSSIISIEGRNIKRICDCSYAYTVWHLACVTANMCYCNEGQTYGKIIMITSIKTFNCLSKITPLTDCGGWSWCPYANLHTGNARQCRSSLNKQCRSNFLCLRAGNHSIAFIANGNQHSFVKCSSITHPIRLTGQRFCKVTWQRSSKAKLTIYVVYTKTWILTLSDP